MAINVVQRKRNKRDRNKNIVIIIACEGNNKTEKNYFSNLRTRQKNIKFCPGNDTDPIKIVENLKDFIKKQDISFEDGDRAYCVIDGDIDSHKQTQIEEAFKIAKKEGIEVIMSVPSFEIWYLLHFKYTSKSFNTNKELIKELCKEIPNYDKSMDVFKYIGDKTINAINHAKQLRKYHDILEDKAIDNIKYNPSTDVDKIVEYILK